MSEFDQKTIFELGSYVYALVDPRFNQVFYIGKGEGNRIFDHEAEAGSSAGESLKINTIRDIRKAGLNVQYLILRHKVSAKEALLVEAVLIDYINKFGLTLSNITGGHKSDLFGMMTLDEIRRRYESPPLSHIEEECIIININKKYSRSAAPNDIYEATRQLWVIKSTRIGEPSRPKLKYVLSEYKKFIVEVFEVEHWFQLPDGKGKLRWGFKGHVAPDYIREKYLNKKVSKKPGAANPIMYNIYHEPN